MNVMEELYCTNASAADTMMNTTMRTRIQPSLLCSLIFFTTLPCRRSSVSVEDEVRTSEDSVDMLADSTSTITMPIRISGKVDSIVGMMESYTGMPVGPISILSAYRRPKTTQEVAAAGDHEREQRGDDGALLHRRAGFDGVELLHHLRQTPGAKAGQHHHA